MEEQTISPILKMSRHALFKLVQNIMTGDKDETTMLYFVVSVLRNKFFKTKTKRIIEAHESSTPDLSRQIAKRSQNNHYYCYYMPLLNIYYLFNIFQYFYLRSLSFIPFTELKSTQPHITQDLFYIKKCLHILLERTISLSL